MIVRDFSVDPWLDDAMKAFDIQSEFGVSYLAYVNTITDRPENHAKIANSYSGHAIEIGNIAVIRELQLWVVRVLEKNGLSLPMFAKHLDKVALDIAHVRAIAHPDWPASQLRIAELPNRINAFSEEVDELTSTDLLARIRVRRDESFAHILMPGSGGARKVLKSRGVEEGYSLNEVRILTEKILVLFAEARSILWFESINHLDSVRSMQKHCERFWKLLPNLSDAEKQA